MKPTGPLSNPAVTISSIEGGRYLRDDFAIAAIHGLCAALKTAPAMPLTSEQVDHLSTNAWTLADAMIAKRGM
jgi:hypothetical protein